MEPSTRDPSAPEATDSAPLPGSPAMSAGPETSCTRAIEVERLFAEHNRSLLRVLQARLHSPQEAREVAQEAYVRMLGLDQRDTISLQKSYLFRIATNIANDRLRHRKVEQKLDPLLFFHQSAESTAPAPDQQYEGEQELAIVMGALDMLPPKCLEALLLHRLEGHTFEETAKILHVDPRTARRLVKRALEHCASELAAHAEQQRSRSK